MNAWLLSIVGIVALGVLLEILLADGETAKYIKGVFALAVVLVLVAPLPKFLNKNFDIDDFFGIEMNVQTTFINSITERKNSEREEKLLKQLQQEGVEVTKVKIYYLKGDIDYIDVVKIYAKQGCDKQKILQLVSDKVNCDNDRIKIYMSD